MKIPKELETVTGFSKTLALILFIALPFGGFYLGRMYQRVLDQTFVTPQKMEPQVITQHSSKADLNIANWKEFKDPNKKFTINFPQNWLISFSQSERYKDKSDIKLEGPEGWVDIIWADAYGGACEDPGYEQIMIQSGEETVCHAAHIQSSGRDNNAEFWQLQKQFVKNKPEGIYLNVFSVNKNRELLLKILQSLNLTR